MTQGPSKKGQPVKDVKEILPEAQWTIATIVGQRVYRANMPDCSGE